MSYPMPKMNRNCYHVGQLSKNAHEKVPQFKSNNMSNSVAFKSNCFNFYLYLNLAQKSIKLPSILLQSKKLLNFTSLLPQFCRKCYYFAKEKSKLSFELSLEQFISSKMSCVAGETVLYPVR